MLIKKFFAFFLTVAVAVSITACSFHSGNSQSNGESKSSSSKNKSDSNYKEVNKVNEKKNEYYTPIKLMTGYDSLETDEQKEFYYMVLEDIDEISDEEGEDGTYPCKITTYENVVLSQSEIRLVISAVKMDNPQIFWITDNYGYSNTGGYTALQLYSYESPKTVKEMKNKFTQKVNNFVTSIKDGLSEYDLEILVHDMVIDSCQYDKSVKTAEDDYLSFTPYGALINGKAVCEGYAKCFQYVMSRVGVDCVPVLGVGQKELHMWNAVLINNCWYYVDPSWDDSKDYSRYDYFNITESQLLADHTISPLYSELSEDEICGTNGESAVNFNLFVPQCFSIEDNYYVKNAVHFNNLYSYENDEMVSALYDTANKGEEYFHIYIDPLYLEYTTAVDQLFVSGDQLFFSYIDTVDSMGVNNVINKEGISIIKKENLSVVTVKINY